MTEQAAPQYRSAGRAEEAARAGGVRLASEFISPLDLVAVGLVSAEEAEALAAAENDAL